MVVGSCKKCGGTYVHTRYNSLTDMLDHTCMRCGYNWSTLPLDREPFKGIPPIKWEKHKSPNDSVPQING